jgi:radical SAM protein with 4Fe4S-binding SPASM domain
MVDRPMAERMATEQGGGTVRHAAAGQVFHPRYVVWELTLKCDQRCLHCGSRAGDARARELTRDEAFGVVRELSELGTGEVALIGGEAYLHPSFLDVIEAITQAGMRCSLTTGGRGVTAAMAGQMKRAGLYSASVSIDGIGRTHDVVRAGRGSFDAALAALGNLFASGVAITCNTTLNRLNVPELEALYEVLVSKRVRAWQVQLMAPLGRGADRPDMMIQPWEVLDIIPRLARLKARAFSDRILITVGNNVGYFSQDERLLRSLVPNGRSHWQGCQAGSYVMGIESDGAVKGCPSLQTAHYVGGNLRERPLREIWEKAPQLAFTRRRSTSELWGFCAECPFGSVCYAGCTFTAHALLGRPGNNPYCHYRAKTLAGRGVRERLVPAEPAPGKPFDNGRFDLVIEPLDAADLRPTPENSLRRRSPTAAG